MFDEKEIEDLCDEFISLDDNIFLESVKDISKAGGEAVNELSINIFQKFSNFTNSNNKINNNNNNSSSNNNNNVNNDNNNIDNNDNNNFTIETSHVKMEKYALNNQWDVVNKNFMSVNTFDSPESPMKMSSSGLEDSLETAFKPVSYLKKKKDEIDNEFKEIDEKLISPEALERDCFQRNGWAPNACQLWRSGPSSLNAEQSSSNHLPNSDLTSSVTYNSKEPRTLNTLSSSKRIYSHQQLGVKVEMVYSLLSMLDMNNREDMSKTFLAMSSSAESCQAMRQSGCLPLLIQLIHSSELSQEVRERAAEALHNIIHSQNDERRRKREVRVLKLLQQVREFCDDLKRSPAPEIQQKELDKHPINAIGTLMKFSFDAEHRQAICVLGGLHAISELLQVDHEVHGNPDEGSFCITLRRYAGMSLTNLTFGDCKNKALLCSFNKFMRALVDQLMSPCEDLRQVTASVIRNLSWRADSDSKQALRDVGTVTCLTTSAMEAKKESTLKSILSALWNLSAHCSLNKIDVCSVPGALAFLVKMLKFKSSTNTLAIVENAGGILRNISSHIAVREDYRQILRENNCFEVLLEQLKSPSLTIVSNACGTLWNLSARCPTDQRKLWEMGAISMLRSLVQSKHKMISMGSSAALKNLLAANPNECLLTRFDSTAKSLGLQNLPTLFVRKKRALEQELNITLAETCENIDSVDSPLHLNSLQEFEGKKANSPKRSESRDSVQSTQSDSTYERINQITLKSNEEKLFENKNVTLHSSLDEKSMPRKMVDQKLMKRYKSSMIPTPTFKKVNQDKISEKTKEESAGVNDTSESVGETDSKENRSLDSKDRFKNRIPALDSKPKGVLSQCGETSNDHRSFSTDFIARSKDLVKEKEKDFNESELEQFRKAQSLAKIDSNSLFCGDMCNFHLNPDGKPAKEISSTTEILGILESGEKKVDVEKKEEYGASKTSPLPASVGEKYEQLPFEKISTSVNGTLELDESSRKKDTTKCSLSEGKTVVTLSERNSPEEYLSVNNLFANNSFTSGDKNVLTEILPSKSSKLFTSEKSFKACPKKLNFRKEDMSNGEMSSAGETPNFCHDKASNSCSVSLLTLQNTENRNENITEAVANHLPVATANVYPLPVYPNKGLINLAEVSKQGSTETLLDASEDEPQSVLDVRSKLETPSDDTIHLKTFSGNIFPKFKVGSPITDSRVLQMDANRICREIKKRQDLEMGCSLTSEMSLVSSSSFLDTGDYSLFEYSAEAVDFSEGENADPGKGSYKLKNSLLRKSTNSQGTESASLPSLGSLKNEQIETLDLDSSILSVASITSEIAETYSKDFDIFDTYTKTYKADVQKDFVEDSAAADDVLVSNEDDTLNADLLQNNSDIFDEDNSLHSQENLPIDTENFEGVSSNQVKKKLTPKEKRKTFQERYRTYTIRNFNDCKGSSAVVPLDKSIDLKTNIDVPTSCECHDRCQNDCHDRNIDNGNQGWNSNGEQEKTESFPKEFPSTDFETFSPSKKYYEEQNFNERYILDSKSSNGLLSKICPNKRKELVENAKLVAFSLKTAVQNLEVASDSELEEPHTDIDTVTYNKNFQDVKFRSLDHPTLEHYEESVKEDLEKKGARISKPDEKSHENPEVLQKGIRGRRRPLHSSPLKHPLRINGSSLNFVKMSEEVIDKYDSGTCAPPALHRQDTFTKDDGTVFKKGEVKNVRSIPVLYKHNESRNSMNARSVVGNKPGTVSGNSKRVVQNQGARIVRPLTTHTSKANERRSESDCGQRRPSPVVTSYKTGGDVGTSRKLTHTGLTSPKMRNSCSSQNVRSENNSGNGCSNQKSRNLALQTMKSHSDASLNLAACKDMVPAGKQRSPRKEITSKIASLWRKVEETKQQNKSLKDHRVWINSEKPPKADEVSVIEQEDILDIPTRKIVHSLTCQTLSDETFKDPNFHLKITKNVREFSRHGGSEDRKEKIERKNVISAVVSPYNYSPPSSEKTISSKIADTSALPKILSSAVSNVSALGLDSSGLESLEV